jgi:hypothetical protein
MSDLGKVVDKGKKKEDSDSSDDDSKPAAKGGGRAAPSSAATPRSSAPSSKAAAKTADSDGSSDDEGPKMSAKEQMQKKKEEAEKRKAAILIAKQEKERAALVDGEDIEEGSAGQDPPEGVPELKRRDEKAKTRFSKTGESLDVNRDGGDEDRTRTGELLVRNPARIPWIRKQRSVDFLFAKCQGTPEEEDVYMTLASAKKSEKTMAKVREQMRKQGLYVAQERVLLPGNVERAIQRVRARKEHAARKGTPAAAAVQMLKSQSSISAFYSKFTRALTLEILYQDANVVGRVSDPYAFSTEEERYLVPFDPLKERCSRPAMRYDPYLPYLQAQILKRPLYSVLICKYDSSMPFHNCLSGACATDPTFRSQTLNLNPKP